MNFLKNDKKGISGIEISIAVLVITIGLSLIASLITSINKTSVKVTREIIATQLAKQAFEKIKIKTYVDFVDLINEATPDYATGLGIENKPGFTLDLEIITESPENLNEAILFNIRKTGNVVIGYTIGSENFEVKLPFFKYIDKLDSKNEPDLNSTSIVSDKTYSASTSFEPGYMEGSTFTLATNIDEWREYGTGEEYFADKYARRQNTQGTMDYFKWEPRYISVSGEEKYLIGKTMFYLASYDMSLEYPAGTPITLRLVKVEEATGSPLAGTEAGRWVKI